MKLPQHMMIGDNGSLYDTRGPNWSAKPLRKTYYRHYETIKTTAQFKATLRAGAYTERGGYPLYFVTWDCASLCFKCARKEARNVISAIADKRNDGWQCAACDINYETSDLYCDHCSKPIPSAYAMPNEVAE